MPSAPTPDSLDARQFLREEKVVGRKIDDMLFGFHHAPGETCQVSENLTGPT
jgi:hypothetical protein